MLEFLVTQGLWLVWKEWLSSRNIWTILFSVDYQRQSRRGLKFCAKPALLFCKSPKIWSVSFSCSQSQLLSLLVLFSGLPYSACSPQARWVIPCHYGELSGFFKVMALFFFSVLHSPARLPCSKMHFRYELSPVPLGISHCFISHL